MKVREDFEAWARKSTQMSLTPAPEGCVHPDYYSGTTQRAWEAWQHQQGRIDLAYSAASDGLNDKLGAEEALVAVLLATQPSPTTEEHARIMETFPAKENQ